MARKTQRNGAKGSQFHIQRLVNHPTDPLSNEIRRLIKLDAHETIAWLSPLEGDDFAEYQDDSYVTRLGLKSDSLTTPLSEFWPAGGPQWDALARTSRGRVILVEGKSHRSEMASACRASRPESVTKIRSALEQTRIYCRADVSADWSAPHYQYSNRLAHLYWLRQLNGINAHLVFVYFVNNRSINNPTSAAAWETELARVHHRLGLHSDPMPGFVHNLFIDADQLQA